jgi:hypothetical protein
MTRRRDGRPPLDPSDPSTKVCIALPSKRYDALYRQAAAARISVPELIRRSLPAANIPKLHAPKPDR